MAKRSWPFGVTSWDDTVKFAQLLFGVDVAFENYAERLPHRSNKSFLLFATSLQQALQYAQNDKLRNRMAADMKAVQIDSFDHNSNIQVQFTSNHAGRVLKVVKKCRCCLWFESKHLKIK